MSKKLKGYEILKEARAIAREQTNYWYTDIYLESDGSYSVGNPADRKSKFLFSVDKSGAKYTKKYVRDPVRGKFLSYIRQK